MPKVIDHEKRRIVILRKAFRLFARYGYQNTSLSQLAETCELSRPTLYLYFHDKEEIFSYAVKYYTDVMFSQYCILAEESGPQLPLIRKIITNIILECWRNRDFIVSLGDFLLQMRYEGRNFSEIVRRRTVKLDHLLGSMLDAGVQTGELRMLPVSSTVMQILDLIQAFLFKLTLYGDVVPQKTIDLIHTYLNGFKKL